MKLKLLIELANNNGRILALKSRIEHICNENRDLMKQLEKLLKEE